MIIIQRNVGDVILYDWDDNGVGDCTDWSDHVGIVVSCDGSTIRVIEGNKSNTVGYRDIAVNGKCIRGFITPHYAAGGSVTPQPSGKKSVQEVAKEVYAGEWGNNPERKHTCILSSVTPVQMVKINIYSLKILECTKVLSYPKS